VISNDRKDDLAAMTIKIGRDIIKAKDDDALLKAASELDRISAFLRDTDNP
jgi:hypothetical protein